MDVGDKVRVWKLGCGVPVGSIGVVKSAEEETFNNDSWVELLEVDFDGNVVWLMDLDVAVVGDWRDRMYLEDEKNKVKNEELARKRVEEAVREMKKAFGVK